MDVSEFDAFYERIEPEYEQSERARLSRPGRKRDIGGEGASSLFLSKTGFSCSSSITACT